MNIYFFQVTFIYSALNSLKWHFPFLLWTTSTGVYEVSSLQKSHQKEILTLIKKQWQKEWNIFLGRLTSDGPTTTILENYASNNDFSNPSKKPSCHALCLLLCSHNLTTLITRCSCSILLLYYWTIQKCSLLLIVTKQLCEVLCTHRALPHSTPPRDGKSPLELYTYFLLLHFTLCSWTE